jgi:hypothetical protein
MASLPCATTASSSCLLGASAIASVAEAHRKAEKMMELMALPKHARATLDLFASSAAAPAAYDPADVRHATVADALADVDQLARDQARWARTGSASDADPDASPLLVLSSP